MHHSPNQYSSENFDQNTTSSSPKNIKQHGIRSQQQDPDSAPRLLTFPRESLTNITSWLDPPSLLAFGRVNRELYSHVKDDNIWHRAFLCQFLGVGPESDLNVKPLSLMLRRHENSWRNEFISRYNLRRYASITMPSYYILIRKPVGDGSILEIQQSPTFRTISRCLPCI